MTDHAKGTALITGASSGIGAIFARQLAFQKYDLVLVARRLDRLQSLADELRQRFAVTAEVISADLSAPADLGRVEKRIAELDSLTLLVNNAGFSVVGTFSQAPLDQLQALIDVHVTATIRLCHAALPGMAQRKQGAIINVSSLAAFLPSSVVYAATKACLNTFSEALQMELRGTGISVQALCPGYTHTEQHDRPEFNTASSRSSKVPKFMWMSADDVVGESLRALGHGPVICIPGWINRLLGAAARSVFGPLIINALSGRPANQT